MKHLPARIGAATGWLEGAKERVQLIEMQLADVVDRFACNREQQPGRSDAGAVAIGTDVLDHHLVEPSFHSRAGFASLPVTAIMALDSPRDAAEADLFAFPTIALLLRLRRHQQGYFLL